MASTQLAHTRYPAAHDVVPDALPVVLVHGLGGTQYGWRPVVDGLSRFGEVVTIDLPGFGRSPVPPSWTLAGAATALDDTLASLGIERCVLVGHSLGAGVVVRQAVDHPLRIAALGLVSPAGFAGRGDGAVSARFAAVHAAWRTVLRFGPSELLRVPAVRRRVFGPLVHDTTVIGAAEARELALGAARGRSTVEARAAITAADLLGELRDLDVPLHVVWGRRDRITPHGMARRVVAAAPGARLTSLEGVGHMPMWERPDAVVAAIGDLMRATS